MERLTLRLPADLVRRFDAAASEKGGRSRYLRTVMEAAAQRPFPEPVQELRSGKSRKLTLRMNAEDMSRLDAEAGRATLLRTQWAVALIRRRLHGRMQPAPAEASALIGIQRELHRIGVNINQIARALNTAVMEGSVLDLELVQLASFAVELRAHLKGVRDAVSGNLDYWAAEP